MAWRVLLVSILIQTVAVLAGGRDYSHREQVPVLVNNVGPFNNPAETYPYYTLPFCAPKDTKDEDEKLGESLAGDRRQYSLYDMRFKVDVDWRSLCHFRLSQDEIRAFSDAIRENYVFEMFIDDLPVKGFVGEIEHTSMKFDTHMHNQSHIYLFTHLDFSVAYNGPNIIAVNLTTDAAQRVELQFDKDIDVEFSYAMQWVPTTVPWVDRMSLHQKSAIGDQAVEIHWLSIINSFVLVVLLTAFLAIILFRVLKKDFARYMEVDETELPSEDDAQEIGWKQVHGDVFRPPPNLMLFSAMVGTGAQVLVLVVSILLLALVGTFYPGNRGAVYTAAICLYAITAVVAGYVSTTLYVSLGGQKWATNAVLTACLFALPFFTIFIVINSVAVAYGSSSALRFTIVLSVFFSWAAVSLPMTIVGSMKAKKAAPFDAPCKTNRAEREIPPVAWYRSLPIQMFIAGFLPFSAIYIELHYIFASVWGHRVYTLFGILSLAFIMLIIVTAFITIALTYFLLAAEDYRWWWRSFLSGSSTGVFMYAYAVFYYVYRSEMNGSLQATFFFGYMLVISYAFSLMLGSVGFYMARKFVKHIYSSIKID